MTNRSKTWIRLFGIYIAGMLVTGFGWIPHFGVWGLVFPLIVGLVVGHVMGQVVDNE